MALDTKAKRGSVIGLACPSRSWLSEPSGTVGQDERKSLLKLAAIDVPMAAPVITSPADDPHAVTVGEGVTALISVSFLGVPLSEEPALSGTDAALFAVVDQGVAAAYTSPVAIEFADPAVVGSYEFTLTLENTGGTDTVTFEVTVNAAPSNDTPANITDSAFRNRTLTATAGAWTDDDSLSYQWVRSDDGSGTGAVNISGATSLAYTPTVDDEGKYLSIDETATNSYGSDVQRSNYVFCYERVALPTATAVERNISALATFDGEFLFNESMAGLDAHPVSVCPDPVTWETDSPQGTVDWSCVAIAVDDTNSARNLVAGCTKISENWGVVAKHAPGDGSAYFFMEADNTEIEVARDLLVIISSNYDLALVRFADPIPDADIPPAKILTRAAYNSVMGAGAEFLGVECDRHLNVLEADGLPSDSVPSLIFSPTTADVIEAGDSGKPGFILNGTTPLLVLTAFYTSAQGPCPSYWLDEIQAVLATTGDELTLYRFDGAGGGGMGTISGAIRGCIVRSQAEEDQA